MDELRSALIKTLIAILITGTLSLLFSERLFSYLTEALPPGQPLALFSPQEGFATLFKLAFWGGFLFAMPYWAGLWIKFLLPAFRGRELIAVPLFLLTALIFAAVGLIVGLKVTLPLANHYLYQFNQTIGVNLWSASQYFDYVWLLLLAHLIAFEAGAILLCLVHLGVISWRKLVGLRRQAVIGSLILGAILTPPDLLTQIAIALPLYGFFELAILYGKARSTLPGHEPDRCGHAHPDKASIPPSGNQTPPSDP